MKKFFLTTKWNGVSYDLCVKEAEVVRYDFRTEEDIDFNGVSAERVFSTKEEAQGALNELVNILKQ